MSRPAPASTDRSAAAAASTATELQPSTAVSSRSDVRRRAQRESDAAVGLLVAAAGVVAGVLGALALVGVLPGAARGAGLFAWLLVGPGAAWTWLLRGRSRALQAALTSATGMVAAVGLGTVLADRGWWHPGLALGALWSLAFAGCVAGVVRRRRAWTAPRRLRLPQGADLVAWVLLVAMLALWGAALAWPRTVHVGDFGLLVARPGLLVAGLGVAAAVVVAFARRQIGALVAGVGAMIVVLRLPGTLLTQVPQLFYTYAHLGVVDLVELTGRSHPDVDIYGAWPGFFAAMAMLHPFTGVSDLAVAHWFTPVEHVLLATAAVAVARALPVSRRVALLAAFVGEASNWVGQDYYSPQAVGLVLGLTIIAVLLARRTRWLAWAGVAGYAALVVTHQLTPVWVLLVALGLVVLRRRRLWLPVLAMAVLLGIDIAANFAVVAPYGLISGVSVANTQSNIATIGVPGRQFAQLVCKLPALALWGGTVVVLGLRALRTHFRRLRPVLLRGLLALSSFVILGGQSYGGEAIFRVFLYSITGCSIVLAEAAGSLTGRFVGARLRRAGLALTAVGTLAVTAVGMQASLGTWNLATVNRTAVSRADQLFADVPAPARLIGIAPGQPSRPTAAYAAFVKADGHFDDTLLGRPNVDLATFRTESDLDRLDDLIWPQSSPTYLVFTPESREYARFYGLTTTADYDRFLGLVAASPQWERVPGFGPGEDVFRWVGPR